MKARITTIFAEREDKSCVAWTNGAWIVQSVVRMCEEKRVLGLQECVCDDSLAAQLLLRLPVTVSDPGISGSPVSSHSSHCGFWHCQPGSRRHGGKGNASSLSPQNCSGLNQPEMHCDRAFFLLVSARRDPPVLAHPYNFVVGHWECVFACMAGMREVFPGGTAIISVYMSFQL